MVKTRNICWKRQHRRAEPCSNTREERSKVKRRVSLLLFLSVLVSFPWLSSLFLLCLLSCHFLLSIAFLVSFCSSHTHLLSCFLFFPLFPHVFYHLFLLFISISPAFFLFLNCFSIIFTFIFISSFLISLPSKSHTRPSSRLVLFLFLPSPPSFGPLSFCTTSSAFFLSSPPRPLLSLPPHPLLFSSLYESGRTEEVCVCTLACCTAVSLRSMFYYYHHHLFSV